MDELVRGAGQIKGLVAELEWKGEPLGKAADATWGSLRLLLDGVPVWHGEELDEGFVWSWVELLEFLSSAWPYIGLEDGFPFGLQPGTPAELRVQARTRWRSLSAPWREEEEEHFDAFAETHDLSRALQGAVVPSVWVVREGLNCWLSAPGRHLAVPLGEVLAVLVQLGDAVAERLAAVEDERGRDAVQSWHQRNELSLRSRASIATGLEENKLRAVEAGRSPSEVWESEEGLFGLNEVLAAARMAASLPSSELSRVIDAVREIPRRRSPRVDELATGALEVLAAAAAEAPHDQGYALAEWLREQITPHITGQGRVLVEQLLDHWDIQVVRLELLAPEIDAVACWGPRHGPAVLMNVQGQHARSRGGRRATLAHEIAHLLVDRAGALPLAEVLGGQTSPLVEARARAFAAELLLPRAIANRQMAQAQEYPETELKRLRQRYEVSTELAAWQAHNGPAGLPSRVDAYLRTKVSRPWPVRS